MRRMLRTAAGALLLVASCGVGPDPSRSSERAGSAASSIQGGTTDTSHDFAVALCVTASGDPEAGKNCQIICSGALLAPNLAVSARHCVDKVSSGAFDCSVDTFGPRLTAISQYFVTTDPDVYDPHATWHGVTQIITPSEAAFCGNDLALLILDANVPSSVVTTFVTPEIWYPIDAPQFSGKATAIGYGLDSPTDLSSGGVRRILENVAVECVPGNPDRAHACAPEAMSGIAANEFLAGDGLCEGDSGSGAYEQTAFDTGSYLALGVLSRGGVSGKDCAGSVYTQLYAWRSLVLGAARRAATLGGYPLPSWTTAPKPLDAGSTTPSDAGSPPSSTATAGACNAASVGDTAGSGLLLMLGLGAALARRRRRM
jgi:MYXO-CTERM domain-containing protein